MKLATAKYRQENDSLEEFLSECCDIGKLNTCKNTDLYGAYLNFCGMSGLSALSQHKFSPELNQRQGIKSTRTKHGVTWIGIDLKKEWKFEGKKTKSGDGCSFEDDPTSQAGDSKGVGSSPNAQSLEDSFLRENLAHKATQATPPTPTEATDNDSPKVEPTPGCSFRKCGEGPTMSKIDRPTPTKKLKDDPSFQKFKAEVRRREQNTCRLCGQHFEIPLTIGYQGGYICEPCRRDGPPPEPVKADSQTKLEGKA